MVTLYYVKNLSVYELFTKSCAVQAIKYVFMDKTLYSDEVYVQIQIWPF